MSDRLFAYEEIRQLVARYAVATDSRDLDALVTQLRAQDVWIDENIQDSEYGKFAWIRDADGNRIELWQPGGDPLP